MAMPGKWLFLQYFTLNRFLLTTDAATTKQPSSMELTLSRAYPLRSSNQSGSTSGARWSDAAMSDKDKQICLSTLLSTGFDAEVCSYLAFHS